MMSLCIGRQLLIILSEDESRFDLAGIDKIDSFFLLPEVIPQVPLSMLLVFKLPRHGKRIIIMLGIN